MIMIKLCRYYFLVFFLILTTSRGTPTSTPTIAPTSLSIPITMPPSMSLVPTETASPTLKPSEFPTLPPIKTDMSGAIQALREAWAVVIVLMFVGFSLSWLSIQHEGKRTKRKEQKQNNYLKLRNKYRNQLLKNVSRDETIFNDIIIKEKYWLGDHIVVLKKTEEFLQNEDLSNDVSKERKAEEEEEEVIDENKPPKEIEIGDFVSTSGNKEDDLNTVQPAEADAPCKQDHPTSDLLTEDDIIIIKSNLEQYKERGYVVDIVSAQGSEDVYKIELALDSSTEVDVDSSSSSESLSQSSNPSSSLVRRKSKKKYVRYEGKDLCLLSCALDDKVRARYPERDFDEEEREEIANEDNVLFAMLSIGLYPLSIMFYKLFCEVKKVRKVSIVSKHVKQKKVDEDEEDSVNIDGFPVDCGTKQGKFLSMAKCVAITAQRHPHVEVFTDTVIKQLSEEEEEEEDDDDDDDPNIIIVENTDCDDDDEEEDGDDHDQRNTDALNVFGIHFHMHLFKHKLLQNIEKNKDRTNKKKKKLKREYFVQPYELYRDVGSHVVSSGPLMEFLPSYFTSSHEKEDILNQYGIGISLYFKFLKSIALVLTIAALFALLPISFFFSASAWSSEQQSLYLEVDYMKYLFFFTSVGSLRGNSFICNVGYEHEKLSLACDNGKIERVEAYYGTPEGACSCPLRNQIQASTGECIAQPNYDNNDNGVCSSRFSDTRQRKPCFKGNMWNGDVCCASMLSANSAPNFADLAFLPNPTCDSSTAQFILNGLCHHQSNCSLFINSDSKHNYSWPSTVNTPCPRQAEALTVDGVPTCYSSLSPLTSNYSSCPSVSNRKLIVRGICTAEIFEGVSWINDGKQASHAEWALGLSWLDALLNALIFAVIVWVSEKEASAVLESDQNSCSADDYTLRVLHIPSPTDRTADVNKLRRQLAHYFNDLLTKLPPVIMDRPAKVFDINFGLNNQAQIKDMKKRGLFARKLDLEQEKLKLMIKYGAAHSENDIFDQIKIVKSLKAEFIKLCEKVKIRKERIEVKTAFITFDCEEGYERIKKYFITHKYHEHESLVIEKHKQLSTQNDEKDKNSGKLSFFEKITFFIPFCFFKTIPKDKKYKGKYFFKMSEVMKPSDYIWENVSLSPSIRFVKVGISNILAVSILIIAFSLVLAAKQVESSSRLKLGNTDCTLYQFDYSGDPSWNAALMFHFNASSLQSSSSSSSSTAIIMTRYDVATNVYPKYYNNTDPNSGLLGCFCLSVLASQHTQQTSKIEFENPNTNQIEYLCDDYLSEFAKTNAMSTLAVLSVVIINEFLKQTLASLVQFESHETKTQELLAIVIKVFLSMLLNIAFIVMLINGNLNQITGNQQDLFITKVLRVAPFFNGSIEDFNYLWYLNVGTAIALTMFANIYATNIAVIKAYLTLQLARIYDRSFHFYDMSLTKKKIQIELENLYTGPYMKLEERYSNLLVTFFVCTMFSAGMPVFWLLLAMTFVVVFFVDKWALLRLYRLPPKYGPELAMFSTEMLAWAVLMHACLAAWMYSAPDLFDYYSYDNRLTSFDDVDDDVGEDGNMSSFTDVDYWGPPVSEEMMIGEMFNRELFHRNALPHVLVMFVWAGWFLLCKCFRIGDVLRFFHNWCSFVTAQKKSKEEVDNHAICLDIEPDGSEISKKGHEEKKGLGQQISDSGSNDNSENSSKVIQESLSTEGEDEANSNGTTSEVRISNTSSRVRLVSDKDEVTVIEQVNGRHRFKQQSLLPSQAARIEYESLYWPNEIGGDADAISFLDFFDHWCKVKGSVESQHGHIVKQNGTAKSSSDTICHDLDFRNQYLIRCEEIAVFQKQSSLGNIEYDEDDDWSEVEGNADLLWSIPTEMLSLHLKQKVLRKDVLACFQCEYEFRLQYPVFYDKISRQLTSLVSYDLNTNEEYIDAFALDSKSIKEYLCGHMTVTGEDFKLAYEKRGLVRNILGKFLLGESADGDDIAIFSDISNDLSEIAQKHVTQIGFDPNRIHGPRFILNLKVPPPPLNLVSELQEEYDATSEKWQYLEVSVSDMICYRIRLPKGLQHAGIPEIQIEIPAVAIEKKENETGQVRSRQFSIVADGEVEKGNRMEVPLTDIGVLKVQFPLHVLKGTKTQFHLPVADQSDYGVITDRCQLIPPNSGFVSKAYGTDITHQGWATLFDPLDSKGLSVEPASSSPEQTAKNRKSCCGIGSKSKNCEATRNEVVVDMDKFLENSENSSENKTEKLDPHRHCVWYQVMTFAPCAVLKNFHKLNYFQHELSHLPPNAIVMTLKPGNEAHNEHIECRIPLHCGEAVHLQTHKLRIPGLAENDRFNGFRAVTVLASNEVTTQGLQGVNMIAKGILPWGDRAVERNVLIPDAIDEIVFDYPAIRLTVATATVVLALLPKKQRMAEEMKQKNRKYLDKTIYSKTINICDETYDYYSLFSKKEIEHLCLQHQHCCWCCFPTSNNMNVTSSDADLIPEIVPQINKNKTINNENIKNSPKKETTKLGERHRGSFSGLGSFQKDSTESYRPPKILIPHLGKFDINWPREDEHTNSRNQSATPRAARSSTSFSSSSCSNFQNISIDFPAIEPNHSQVHAALGRTSHEKRLQVGWVLIELPIVSETTNNTENTSKEDGSAPEESDSPKLFMRLPAYVMGRNVALASLPSTDQASASWRLAANQGQDPWEGRTSPATQPSDHKVTTETSPESRYDDIVTQLSSNSSIASSSSGSSSNSTVKSPESSNNPLLSETTKQTAENKDENNAENKEIKADFGNDQTKPQDPKKKGWCLIGGSKNKKPKRNKHERLLLTKCIKRALSYKLSKAFEAWRGKVVMYKLMVMMGDDDDDDDDDDE